MAYGSLKVKLRPLRLAFLVQPFDRVAISTAIETASFLWGGAFNPIIPVYDRLPKNWGHERKKDINARLAVEGYIDAFDPDFIVKVGALESKDLKYSHRTVINCSEILKPVMVEEVPAYGIGLFELLRHFYEKELKFLRHSPLCINLPKPTSHHALFLTSVFGALSDEISKMMYENFGDLPGFETKDCSLENYAEFLAPKNLFIRRFGTLDIRPIRQWHQRGDCIFFMDASSTLDILDYWNLRALGWNIIPVCRQAAAQQQLQSHAAEFANENAYAMRGNPNIFNHTTILCSRTVSMAEVEQFGRALRPKLKPPAGEHDWKIVYQPSFPRIWDEWAREKDGAALCELEVREEEYEIGERDDDVRFKGLTPKFANRFGVDSTPRCANDIELRLGSSTFLPAEVVPEGDWRIAQAAGAFGFDSWRCAKSGLVLLPRHVNWNETLSLKPSEFVFTAWLQARKWEVELSDKGHIAKQMLKQLNGKFGIKLLAKEGMIEFLGKFANGRTLSESAFRGELAQIVNKQKHQWPPINRLSEWLVNARVVQPGLEIQCPICRQHSWYSVKETDYELNCQKCLESFELPGHNLKEVVWAYRTIGPFSLPQQAYGVYTVLLTLKFFAGQLGAATTPILSFKAKNGPTSIEADLGLFFQKSSWEGTRTDLVFVECKTFNHFERKDAVRMLSLAKEFPGAVLVFATLRKSLTDQEKHILQPVVNRGRRYWRAECPYNPVLILTGNELLTDQEPRQVWKELGGKFAHHSHSWGDQRKLVSLADATQQIYLDMKPWHKWLEDRRKLRKQKQPIAPPQPSKPTENGDTPESTITLSFPITGRQVPWR